MGARSDGTNRASLDKGFIFIIGAMKSGTSAVYSLLAQHPQICPSHPKEPQFFIQKDYDPTRLDDYLAYFHDPGDHIRYYLEASTSYTKMPHFPCAAERIRDTGLRAKFIYMLRNPVDRIESQINMSKYQGWKAFNKDDEVKKLLVDISRYYYQAKQYFDRFPESDILLVCFEEFTRDPSGVIERICRFLDLEPGFRPRIEKMDEHSGAAYAYRNRIFLRYLRSLLDRVRYMVKWSGSMSGMATRTITKLDNIVHNKIYLSPGEKEKLIDLLRDDLIQLRDELGVDIGIWNLIHEEKGDR